MNGGFNNDLKYQLWMPLNILNFYLLILERQRERNIDSLSQLLMHSLLDSYICPDWGSSPQPLAYQDNALTNWATWPGLPLNVSEQEITGWMWYFRDVGLVDGLSHCIHLRGRYSKSSALTQNESSHRQGAVYNRIVRWGYSKGNHKFSCRVLYFMCCWF